MNEQSNQGFWCGWFPIGIKMGALAEQNICGICLEVCDVVLNEDATRRGTGDQIIKVVRRAAHDA